MGCITHSNQGSSVLSYSSILLFDLMKSQCRMFAADPGGHWWFWFRLQRWARRASLANATAIGLLKTLIALVSLCFSFLRHFSCGLNTKLFFAQSLFEVWSVMRQVQQYASVHRYHEASNGGIKLGCAGQRSAHLECLCGCHFREFRVQAHEGPISTTLYRSPPCLCEPLAFSKMRSSESSSSDSWFFVAENHCDTSLLNAGVLSTIPGLWRTLWLAGQWQGGYRCEETITAPFSNHKVKYTSFGGGRLTSWLCSGRLC